jgi:hypothetical protein
MKPQEFTGSKRFDTFYNSQENVYWYYSSNLAILVQEVHTVPIIALREWTYCCFLLLPPYFTRNTTSQCSFRPNCAKNQKETGIGVVVSTHYSTIIHKQDENVYS